MAEFLDEVGLRRVLQSVNLRITQVEGGGATISSVLGINKDGNWTIDGIDTGVKAQGPAGRDGPPGPQGPAGPSGGTPIDRMIAEPDKSRVGFIHNRELVVQQTTPFQFGVVKCRAECVCCPTLISWKTMGGTLKGTTKHNKNMFTPIQFTDRLASSMNE